jgi:hypothetical protein
VAAVTLTAQNTSDAISGLALQFLSVEVEKEYARNKRLRHFQSVVTAMSPARPNVNQK